MTKLRAINFNYTNRLHLVLVIRNYFDKKNELPQSTSSMNPGQIKIILISS